MTNQLLSVEDVHKAYAVNPVLRGINLGVEAHEVVVLVGASGSGKSTLLRCINGLESIDAGRIMLDNTLEVSAPHANLDAVRQRVGIVFQSFNLFPHLSVLDNVTLAPRKVRGTSRRESEGAARELLSRFGLGDKADSFPDRLSGGQQQRVAIVRALAMDPELMLFDEITSALDPQLVGEVLDVVRELSESGMTIVMDTHEMTFAREVAHRICFLDAGSVLEEGPPEQVFDNPVHELTREFLSRTRTR